MKMRIGTLVTLGLVLAIVRIGGQAPPAQAARRHGVRPIRLLDSSVTNALERGAGLSLPTTADFRSTTGAAVRAS
jgi:hypothetical protein